MFGLSLGLRNHYTDMGIFSTKVPSVRHIPITFFYNPNNYGVFLVLGMLMLLSLFSYAKGKKVAMACIAAYLIAQLQLIFTTSRTAWIGLLMGICMCIVFAIINRDWRLSKGALKAFLVSSAVFIMLSSVPFMKPYYGEMYSMPLLNKLFKNEGVLPAETDIILGGNGSVNQRFTLIYDVIEGVIKEGNYLGFGAGNIEEYIEERGNTGGVYNPHSLWVELLGDFGLVIALYAIVIYVRLMLSLNNLYKNCCLNRRPYVVMLGACLFAFVFLSFGPSSVISFTPFWMLVGGAAALVRKNQKDRSEAV